MLNLEINIIQNRISRKVAEIKYTNIESNLSILTFRKIGVHVERIPNVEFTNKYFNCFERHIEAHQRYSTNHLFVVKTVVLQCLFEYIF